nr:hypothetical protein [Pseudomonas sp. UBA6718]
MFYEKPAIELSRELMESGNLSYSQLASHLERIYPRKDSPWTDGADGKLTHPAD